MKINLHCYLLSFIKKSKINLHWVKQLKVGEISWWNKCFHYHVGHNFGTQLLQLLFPAQQLWFSPIMPEGLENTWEIRYHSSSRISPDPSDSQLHVSTSSLQFTSLIFYRVQVRELNGHSRSLVLCPVTHFCVVFEVCMDYCPVGRSKHGPL